VIARIWRGWTSREDAEAYVRYMEKVAVYPEDDRYLVERELTVSHFDYVAGTTGTDPAPAA
jgi:hypothetical protein